jgi:hypothetical protein
MRTAMGKKRIIAGGVVVLTILVLIPMIFRNGENGHGAHDPRTDSPIEITRADPETAAESDPEAGHHTATEPEEATLRAEGGAMPVVLRLAPVQVFDGFRWPLDGTHGLGVRWRYSLEPDIDDLASISARMLDASVESEIVISDIRSMGERMLLLAGEGDDYDVVPSIIGMSTILDKVDGWGKSSSGSTDGGTTDTSDSKRAEGNYAIWELPPDSIQAVTGEMTDEAKGGIPIFTVHVPIVPLSRCVIEISHQLGAFKPEWNEVVYIDEAWAFENLVGPSVQGEPDILWNLYYMSMSPFVRQRRFEASDSRIIISGHMYGQRKFQFESETPDGIRLFETETMESSLGVECVSGLREIAPGELEVRVVDPADIPVEGASVTVQRLYDTDPFGVEKTTRVSEGKILGTPPQFPAQRTSAEGLVHFTDLPYGVYRVSAAHPPGTEWVMTTKLIRQGAIASVALVVCEQLGGKSIRIANMEDRYNGLHLSIVNRDNPTVVNRVALTDLPIQADRSKSGWGFGLSGTDGNLALQAALHPDSGFVAAFECGDIELKIQDLQAIELHITTLSGREVGKTKVQFVRVPTLLTSRTTSMVLGDHLYWRTDDMGVCRLPGGFHPFLYAVRLEDSKIPIGFVDFRDPLPPSTTKVVHMKFIDQDTRVSVTNRETGAPIGEAAIVVLPRGGLEQWYGGARAPARHTYGSREGVVAETDSSGSVVLPHLPETLDLLVWAEGFRSELLTLEAPHDTRLLVELTPTRNVPITVVDSDSRLPIPGVRVLRALSDDPGPAILAYSALSDWDGITSIDGLSVPFTGTLLVAREAFIGDPWEGRPVWTEQIVVDADDEGRIEVVVPASVLE